MREAGGGFEFLGPLRVAGELLAVVKGHRRHLVPAGTQRVEQAGGDGGGFAALDQGDPGVTTLPFWSFGWKFKPVASPV